MPKEYLYEFDLSEDFNSLHMIMAHLILEDNTYAQWSKERKKLGRYVILDNSAPYFEHALDDISLLKCIDLIEPNEVVLPDIINNFKETVQRHLRFMELLRTKKYLKLMAVPQGNTLQEYIQAYKLFSSDKRIEVIGVSYTVDNLFAHKTIPKKYISSREYLINILHKKGILNTNKEHHLLGLSSSGNIELNRLKKFLFIRRCDSNAAYINAKRHITFVEHEGYEKQKVPINFNDTFDQQTYKLMVRNINVLTEASR